MLFEWKIEEYFENVQVYENFCLKERYILNLISEENPILKPFIYLCVFSLNLCVTI